MNIYRNLKSSIGIYKQVSGTDMWWAIKLLLVDLPVNFNRIIDFRIRRDSLDSIFQCIVTLIRV